SKALLLARKHPGAPKPLCALDTDCGGPRGSSGACSATHPRAHSRCGHRRWAGGRVTAGSGDDYSAGVGGGRGGCGGGGPTPGGCADDDLMVAGKGGVRVEKMKTPLRGYCCVSTA